MNVQQQHTSRGSFGLPTRGARSSQEPQWVPLWLLVIISSDIYFQIILAYFQHYIVTILSFAFSKPNDTNIVLLLLLLLFSGILFIIIAFSTIFDVFRLQHLYLAL